MIEKKLSYTPDIAIHPGASLKDELVYLNISQKELAQRTGLNETYISQIINGEDPISPDTAIKFEKVIGISADFWNNLQKNHDLTAARIKALKRINSEIVEAKKYTCYSELARLGFVNVTNDWREKVDSLMRFFRVDSLKFVPAVQGVSFRKGKGAFNEPSLLAWLRCGEIQAGQLKLEEFDKAKLKNILPELRKLTNNRKEFFNSAQDLCAGCGVALVYTPYFPGTRVNGSVRWLGNNPLIQLNSRGAYADTFWFTFFHEIGHILLHGKKEKFLDFDGNIKSEEETEADAFAANLLIPKEEYKQLCVKKSLSIQEVKDFAQSVGVDLGVLIGRFAHDGLVSWKSSAQFRRKVYLSD